MRLRGLGTIVVALAVALGLALVALPAGAQNSSGDQSTTADEPSQLRIGWAQDPQTLNPFVALDEENYNVWALTWDLLVNFKTDDLSPAPGIAESWEVSDDKKTVTFKLDPDRKWSDGEPITSADVRYSLDTLGKEGALFTGYTSGIKSIETPDDETVVIETKRPDARLIGGLFVYIIPEHIWGEESVKTLSGSFQPDLPMVGSGPYVVTGFDRGRTLTMEKNPEWQGPAVKFDEIEYIKYGNQDAVERAIRLGEIDMIVEVESSTFNRIGSDPNIETLSSPSPAYSQLAFNLCSAEDCPDAQFNPAIQDKSVRQALGYAIDRERINQIAAKGTAFVANGILPSYYKDFYETPEQTYPFDVEMAKQILDDAGWQDNGDQPRTKDGETLSFDLTTYSSSSYYVQSAKLIAEMAAEIGVEFNVQIVSVDKLTELTTQSVDGKPAPDFDAFVWGWGGDAYDPSFLLSLFTTDQIGNLSDSFYSNPEYDRLYEEQAGIFDVEERRAIIRQMVAITQEDLPYIVFTEDPNLQAYRTDRVSGIEPTCPSGDGDLICEQASYEPFFTIGPADGSSGGSSGAGSGGAVIAIIAAVVVGGGALFLIRRKRRDDEPLELED